MDDIAALKQVPLFSQMDDIEITGIREIMEQGVYAPGQVIMRQGEKGDLFYVVTQD